MAATLLLADDSITIQRVIELTFADEHVRVIAAADGQQAIQRIDHEPPDIVLADVGMPKIDGYGVATYVKQNPALKHIPVLLLTGAFEPIDEAKARATGCEGVLVKPFEPEKLIARVKELLDGARHADLWPADLPRVDVVAEPAPAVTPVAQPVAPPAVAPPVAVRQPAPVVVRQAEPVVVRTPAAAPPPPPPAPVADRPVEMRPVEIRDAAPSRPAPQAAGPVFLDTPNHPMPRPSAPARQQPPRAAELPPPADAFESELDMLDVALSRLEPTAHPQELDAATASDFARDLATLRNVGPEDAPAAERPNDTAPSFGNWDLAPRRTAPPEPMMDLGIDLEEHEPIDVVPVELPAEPAEPAEVVPQSVAPVPALAAVPEPAVILPPPAPLVTPAPVAPSAPVPLAMRVSEPAIVTAPPAPVAPPVVAPPPALQVTPRAPVVPAAAAPAPPPPAPKPTLAGAFSALLAAERAQPAAAAPPAAPVLSEAAVEDVVKRVLARMTDDTVQRVVLDAAERIIREEIERLKSPDAAKPR